MCVNRPKMEIVTGWADGGLRKFELKTYLVNQAQNPPIGSSTESGSLEAAQNDQSTSSSVETNPIGNHAEWNLAPEQIQKDFIRNLVVIEGRIICCTNLGNLNLINTDQSVIKIGSVDNTEGAATASTSASSASSCDNNNNQKLLFKSILLSNYTVMTKIKVDNKWILAIGTLKGIFENKHLKQHLRVF